MSDNRIVPAQNQLNNFNHRGWAARESHTGRTTSIWRAVTVLLTSLVLSASLCAQNAGSLKLPVAHAHFGSWCVGYLTITPDEVRYDATRSRGKDEHSFQLKRDRVAFLNYWVLAGQPMNAVEMRTADKTYHFWLMRSEADLQGGRSAWKPLAAAPSDTLLLSLYYWRVTGNVPTLAAVNTALIQARVAAANAAMAQSDPSGASANGDAYQKMKDHMFVNDYSSKVTTNTINTINHMSHW